VQYLEYMKQSKQEGLKLFPCLRDSAASSWYKKSGSKSYTFCEGSSEWTNEWLEWKLYLAANPLKLETNINSFLSNKTWSAFQRKLLCEKWYSFWIVRDSSPAPYLRVSWPRVTPFSIFSRSESVVFLYGQFRLDFLFGFGKAINW
jgi:hypothetical protein